MKFYYSNENKPLKKVISNPLFYDLVSFLKKDTNDQIILRDLKVRFPQKQFDTLLEQAIQMKLITRKNRRYSLGFPIMESIELNKTMKENLDLLLVELAKYDESQLFSFFIQLWSDWFASEDYFIGSESSICFYEKRTVGNDELKLHHFSLKEIYTNNLVDYFYLQKNETTIPKILQSLETTLGDVSPVYFFDQAQLIFELILDNQIGKIKESIFSEALVETGVVNEGMSKLLIPECFFEIKSYPSLLTNLSFSQDLAIKIVEKAECFDYLFRGAAETSFYTRHKL